MSLLVQAREAVAAYWFKTGFLNDAETVREGRADYSADVQCALIAMIVNKEHVTPIQAFDLAQELTHEANKEGNPSKGNHNARSSTS